MSEKENNKEPSFKVTDRRISFTEEEEKESELSGDTKTSYDQETKKVETKEKAIENEKPEDSTAEKVKTEKQSDDTLPEINFATFILSLSGSAMLHIGDMPNPETGKTEKNLPFAKQSIDILEMLKEKTKGNLASDEEKLLENILYDLRMRYVNARKEDT